LSELERVDDLERPDLRVAIEVFAVEPVNAFNQAGGNYHGVPKGKLLLRGQLAGPIENVPVGQETRPHTAQRFDFLPHLRLGKAERLQFAAGSKEFASDLPEQDTIIERTEQ
jgi:hypothetical protein